MFEENFPITSLEHLLEKLHEVSRKYYCNSCYYEHLKYKPKAMYLTNDGYPLGTIAWYIDIYEDGVRHRMIDRKPEKAVEKAITYFTSKPNQKNIT